MRVDQIAAGLGEHCWTRYSAGAGAKGPRFYEWAFVALHPDDGPGHRWLLIRRHPEHGELAYYRCYSPRPVALTELVRVAGTRWRIEESFQATKTLTGLDEHQVRRWSSWRRWTLIAMLAHALLSVFAAAARARQPQLVEQIPLTCNEIARLLNRLIINPIRSLSSDDAVETVGGGHADAQLRTASPEALAAAAWCTRPRSRCKAAISCTSAANATPAATSSWRNTLR